MKLTSGSISIISLFFLIQIVPSKSFSQYVVQKYKGTIKGTVIDKNTKEGIPKAAIRLYTYGRIAKVLYTDSVGNFSFNLNKTIHYYNTQSPPSPVFEVEASALGYNTEIIKVIGDEVSLTGKRADFELKTSRYTGIYPVFPSKNKKDSVK